MAEKKEKIRFVCPKDGKLPNEEVAFLCNKCGPREVVEKDGLFLCPQCFEPGENFECMFCQSREVRLVEK